MSEIQTIITSDAIGAQLVTFARNTAVQLVKSKLSPRQVRNIFTEVRKIEALWDAEGVKKPEDRDYSVALRRLVMLKPKMDYQTSRIHQLARLKDVLSEAIDYVVQGKDPVEQTQRFKRFMNLFEAILAYHHSEDGSD